MANMLPNRSPQPPGTSASRSPQPPGTSSGSPSLFRAEGDRGRQMMSPPPTGGISRTAQQGFGAPEWPRNSTAQADGLPARSMMPSYAPPDRMAVAMSPVQRSIFRGGHDATAGVNARRGHTAGGGRQVTGTAILGAQIPPATSGNLPQVRQATILGSPNRGSPNRGAQMAMRSQTATGGYGRPQAFGNNNMQIFAGARTSLQPSQPIRAPQLRYPGMK